MKSAKRKLLAFVITLVLLAQALPAAAADSSLATKTYD
jgi:hypothetical protein